MLDGPALHMHVCHTKQIKHIVSMLSIWNVWQHLADQVPGPCVLELRQIVSA